MLVAFEGADNTGKSTSAIDLSSSDMAIYNATVDNYPEAQQLVEGSRNLTQCFDRIDWFSHMVYRLALPGTNWADDRQRTVFAMPDTHLVIKLHRPDLANFVADEVVHTPIARVNPMYAHFAEFFIDLNTSRDYELFKSISVVEVSNDPVSGVFSQRLVQHSSRHLDVRGAPNFGIGSDRQLLQFIRAEDTDTL